MCKRWDCPKCAIQRQITALNRIRAGKPERMVTLTLRPQRDKSLDAQILFIRTAFKRLVARIRRRFQGFEYVATLELQKNGTPHIHTLYRGVYIPQRWLSKAWLQLTGAYKVDIRQVDKVPAACAELVKYFVKTAAQIQAAAPGIPLLVMSRNWLPPGYSDAQDEPEPWDHKIYLHLPISYAFELVADAGLIVTVSPTAPHRYKLTALPGDTIKPLDTALSRSPIQTQKLQAILTHVFTHACSPGHDLNSELQLIDAEARARQLGE